MQLQNIPTASIRPNEYNPNKMTDKTRKTLRGAMTRDGYLQPIIVRQDPTNPDLFVIVDGEHRYELLSEMGYSEIPSVVVTSDENYAKVQTINMNRLRGDHDRIKMAELIVKLKAKYTEDDLQEMLGFDRQEIRSYEDLAGFDLTKISDRTDAINALNGIKDDSLPSTTEYSIPVTTEQLQVIESSLRFKGGARQDALAGICHEYNLNV